MGNTSSGARTQHRDTSYLEFQETEHVKVTEMAMKFFSQYDALPRGELPKDTLFMACIVMPMTTWSSGRSCCCHRRRCRQRECNPNVVDVCSWFDVDVFMMSSWLVRILLIGCFWMQSSLLIDLRRARFDFPSLDGAPHLCTYGQDSGNPSQPYGPNGIPFERNRGNIETNYMNVVIRNGLAQALDQLNMSNPDIGPVEYGMESSSCRLMCVAVLCMWLMRILYTEWQVAVFMWFVPKLFRCSADTNRVLKTLEYVGPLLFYAACIVLTALAYLEIFDSKIAAFFRLVIFGLVAFGGLFWSLLPCDVAGSNVSWIQLEKDAEQFVRSFENCKQYQSRLNPDTDTTWHILRSNLKFDLWSLLEKNDADKFQFEPRCLPWIFCWMEAMPLFTVRLFIIGKIFVQGIIILFNTGGIMDLILDTFAIQLLLELEKLVYSVLAYPWIPKVMSKVRPFATIRRGCEACERNVETPFQKIQKVQYRKGDKVRVRRQDESAWIDCGFEWDEPAGDTEWTIESVNTADPHDGKTYTLVGRNEEFDETELVFVRYMEVDAVDWYGEDNVDEPEDCCHACRQSCLSWAGLCGLVIFLAAVLSCFYVYFRTQCEFQKVAPWLSARVWFSRDQWYSGESTAFLGPQAIFGEWRSKIIKAWDTGIDTCVPFSNMSGKVRAPIGCGQTPAPGMR